MNDLCFLTLTEVALALRSGGVSPSEVLEAVLERTDSVGSALGCFVTVLEEDARRAVAELSHSTRDVRPPLWGVPISVKDNMDVRGVPTTAGSPIRSNATAASDAGAVARLRSAGAIIFAKASLYEFAFGAPNPAFALARNPWSSDRSPGGSSSGSASAVAARVGYASIGTDTGGSIRVPAGFCGVMGLKPTFGHISTKGVVPVAWSLDHVGPIARTAADCALVYNAMVSDPSARVALSGIDAGVRGLRIATALLDDDLDPSVRSAIDVALETLADAGARITYVQMPDMRAARWCLWVISSAEAADYHRTTLLERSADYHPLVRRRLVRGRMLPAADYVRAQRVRRRLAEELASTVAGFDAVVLPLAPVAAYDLHDRAVRLASGIEDASSAVTRFTPLFSLAGWPALAVPCGFTSDRLPIGMQIVAPPEREEMTLRVARAFERATSWHTERPPGPRTVAPEGTL